MASSLPRRNRFGWVVSCGLALEALLGSGNRSSAQLVAPATRPAAANARALLAVPAPEKADAAGGDAVWQRAIATHAALLNDPAVIRTAVESDEVRASAWYAAFAGGPGAADRAAAALAKAVTARAVPGTSLIEVVTTAPVADA